MAKPTTSISRLLLSKSEAAETLSISESTLDRLTLLGAIPVVKVPSTGKVGRPRNMFAVADLQRFIDSARAFNDVKESADTSSSRRTSSRYHSAKEAIRELSVSK